MNNYKWILNSTNHLVWAMKQVCTLGSGPRYTPSDCYETFPFPVEMSSTLEQIGVDFDEKRKGIMADKCFGLTQLYNALHNPSCHENAIKELRELLCSLDNAVLECYGWTDINLDHKLRTVSYLLPSDNIRYTISESARVEILKRLAKLNHDRWEEEQKNG